MGSEPSVAALFTSTPASTNMLTQVAIFSSCVALTLNFRVTFQMNYSNMQVNTHTLYRGVVSCCGYIGLLFSAG